MNTFLKDCGRGRFLLLRGDMVSQYADVYGEWCEQELRLFEKLVSAQGNVVEVGSHIGLHAVPLAKMAAQGRIFCFEPQRILHQILCANSALNNCLNLYAANRAVGDAKGTLEVAATDYATPWNYGSFSVDRGFSTEGEFRGMQRKEAVELCRLDDEPALAALTSLRLLKIDAEGFELQVLRGAAKLIAAHRPVLFVENNKPEKGDELIAAIRALGYECYWFCAERFRPENYNKVGWKLPGADVNMVCFAVGLNESSYGLMKVNAFADLKAGHVPLIRG
jgi:FkbM family methyltransferase